jgi:shikimate dehydrogenase
MKRYAVLGRRIPYSRSPFIHSFLASRTGIDMEYGIYQSDDPESAFDQGFDGFNVTIPYKQSLLHRLSAIDTIAARVGAVNTVKRGAAGWEGYNTDYSGFGALLERAGIGIRGRQCVVLGSGGGARCAALRLFDGGAASVCLLSRSAQAGSPRFMEFSDASGAPARLPIRPYADFADMPPSVIVNATPLGTDPSEEDPFPADGWDKCVAAVDLVYNPFLTPFLRKAVSRGIPSADGLDMLAVQAVRAFEIWNDMKIPPKVEDEALQALRLKAARGIALVGMPLSGKSTILSQLARDGKLPEDVRAADADDEIEKMAGRSIPEIFASEGEAGFRAREHETLKALTRESHVIACGGGALTVPENLALLKDSLIVYVDVPLDELKRRYREARPGSRPLLKTEADLAALYEKRLPVYRSASRAKTCAAEAPALIRRWLEVRGCA